LRYLYIHDMLTVWTTCQMICWSWLYYVVLCYYDYKYIYCDIKLRTVSCYRYLKGTRNSLPPQCPHRETVDQSQLTSWSDDSEPSTFECWTKCTCSIACILASVFQCYIGQHQVIIANAWCRLIRRMQNEQWQQHDSTHTFQVSYKRTILE